MSPLPEGLPPLKPSRAALRFDEPVPRKCDWNHNEALANRPGRQAHFWVSFESFFETKLDKGSRDGSFTPPTPDPRADLIPDWAVCNRCYIVNPELTLCHVYVSTGSYGGSACGRPAKVWRPFNDHGNPLPEGKMAPYCGVHDPVVRAAKKAARDEADRVARAAADEAYKRRMERARAEKEIIEQAREVLRWFDASGIHTEDEWAGTIERKLRPAMEVYDADR